MQNPVRKLTVGAILALLGTACSEAITTPQSPVAPNASVRSLATSDLVSVLATTVYASSVVSNTPGTLANGGPVVDPSRINPSNALGPEDDKFYSLGFGGTLVLKFDQAYSGTLLLSFEQTIVNGYPREAADVYVSKDGVGWVFVGQVDNLNDQSEPVRPDQLTLPAGCWQFVKLVDKSVKADYLPPNPNRPEADGFDVNAIAIQDAVPCAAQGCSQGYFKTHTVAGENNTFASYGVVGSGRDGSTLKSAFSLNGGPSVQDAKDLALKQLAAAILNSTLVSGFPLSTANLVQQANTAFATNNRATILAFATKLEGLNNLGCSLN
jgi:hypothetical protein